MKNTGKSGLYTQLKFEGHLGGDDQIAGLVHGYLDASPVLILDVEGVNFDSKMIGELINLHRAFEKVWGEQPHRIALLNVSEFSNMIFNQVKLDQIIFRCNSVDEALNDL